MTKSLSWPQLCELRVGGGSQVAKSYCRLWVKMKRISTTKLGPKTTPPTPQLDPTAAFLTKSERARKRESKAVKRNYSVERLILCTWCEETHRMKEQCCVQPARDTLVLHWQGPCSCRAGVPVVWVAEAKAGPPEEVFMDLQVWRLSAMAEIKSLESRRPISPSMSFPSLIFYQPVHQSLLHGWALDTFLSVYANFKPFSLPSHPSFPPQSPVTAPWCTVKKTKQKNMSRNN